MLVAISSIIKSYFECRKRDLSDKSTNEEERKTARESSSSLSLSNKTSDDTDAFGEGIESPRSARIIYDCFEKSRIKS